MTKLPLSFLICFLILFSCKEEEKELYSVETICECYTQSEFIGFDKTLKECLTEFNTALNQSKKEAKNADLENYEKNHLMELTKNLIKSCPKYQIDFNTVLLNRYSNRDNTNIEVRIDSLLKVIHSVESKAGNLIKLSELEIINGDYDKAFKSINNSIEMNPKMEMSYFVKGFLNHRKGNLKDAISDLKTMQKITEKPDLKLVADLWILNLEQELK